MNDQELENLIKKIQSGEIKLTLEQKLKLLKEANHKVIELNDWLKNII